MYILLWNEDVIKNHLPIRLAILIELITFNYIKNTEERFEH